MAIDRHTPSEEGSEAEYHEWLERQPVPCCGRPLAYCECPDWFRLRAQKIAANKRDWDELPRSSDDSDPPF